MATKRTVLPETPIQFRCSRVMVTDEGLELTFAGAGMTVTVPLGSGELSGIGTVEDLLTLCTAKLTRKVRPQSVTPLFRELMNRTVAV